MKENMNQKDIAIIGAGPAGLAAAIYAHRAEKSLVILDHQVPGGQLMLSSLIENYPGFPEGISSMELAQRMKEQVEKLGIKIKKQKVESVKKDNNHLDIFLPNEAFKARAVIVATGMTPKKLGIPNEDKFIGKGISFCAICDGPLYRDKQVAVIGGGNAALEEALFLTRFAKRVFIIHRRDELRAVAILQERTKNNNKIEFLYSFVPVEIIGEQKVKTIKIKHKKTNELRQIDIDGVFIYIGSKPNSGVVSGLVKTDERGFVITDSDMQTSQKAIFAAGDVRSKRFRQVVFSCSEGGQAALGACKYLDESSPSQ